MTETPFRPDWSVPPGEMLAEMLAERGWSQAYLAARSGLTTKHINRIIKGKAGIGTDAAIALGQALGVEPLVLARMQLDHDMTTLRRRPGDGGLRS